MKDKFAIIGIIIGIIGFFFYYIYAYFNYNPNIIPPLNPTIAAMNYVPLMFCISFLLIQLMLDSRTDSKFLVYGINAVVWCSISLAYMYRDVLHLISSKTLIIHISILCCVLGFALYVYKSYHR